MDTRTVKPPPKVAAAEYGTAEHREWALGVKRRAGWRCEEVVGGVRCRNHHPTSVMYADHIVEVRDNPALKLDPKNGKCLCASHHSTKTLAERARRMGA